MVKVRRVFRERPKKNKGMNLIMECDSYRSALKESENVVNPVLVRYKKGFAENKSYEVWGRCTNCAI